jgi:hypothetical protein
MAIFRENQRQFDFIFINEFFDSGKKFTSVFLTLKKQKNYLI